MGKKSLLFLSGFIILYFLQSLGLPKVREGNREAWRELVKGMETFALAVYQEVCQEKGNQFYSPLSLSLALSMALEGARDETARQMAGVLHLPLDESRRREGVAQLIALVNMPARKSRLHLANAIWVQKDFQVLKTYLEVVASIYDGRATNVDFINRREEARRMINDWTAEKTADKIKDLIPPGVLNPLTQLVLTNAVYFRGLWLLPFNPELTKPEKFYLDDGKEVEVPMMRLTGERARFPYLETEDWQLLEMLYEGKDLSMLILLPRRRDLSHLETKLSSEALETWKKELKEERVDVYLPRFKMETKYLLKEKLVSFGMPIAFSSQANFSGIDGQKDLFLQQVIHQAFVEVNEEGTEAAGATGVIVGRTAYIPEKKFVFRADHPFLFIIQEKTSGVMLFLGRLVDPR